MAGWAVVNGVGMPADQATVPANDPAVLRGWSVFDTAYAHDGALQRFRVHLARLRASCAAALVPYPGDEVVTREAHEAAARVPGPASVRITVSRSGVRLVVAEPLDPGRRHHPVRVRRGPHRDEPFLGGSVKHGSRVAWMVALEQSGVDDVVLVDSDRRFTESTRAAILAVMGGVLWTAPHDGSILPSTTCREIVNHAVYTGVPVRWERPPADGPWDALYLASTTRDLAPVVEIDGQPLAAWDPVGRALADRLAP